MAASVFFLFSEQVNRLGDQALRPGLSGVVPGLLKRLPSDLSATPILGQLILVIRSAQRPAWIFDVI